MKNKKIIWIFGSLAVAVICLVTVSVISLCTAASVIHNEDDLIKNADIADMMTVEIHDSEPIYFVREHNGLIGVFSEDNSLLETIDVAVITLPKNDRDRLRDGITVKGTKNLDALKEDYTG